MKTIKTVYGKCKLFTVKFWCKLSLTKCTEKLHSSWDLDITVLMGH